jgi:hypothetical protein
MMLMSKKGANPFSALRTPRDGRAAVVSQLLGQKKDDDSSGELQQYSLDDLKVGKATFGLNYRKVGKDFDFTPVASQFADGPQKGLFDKLQKEKGLSTLGFAGNLNLGKNASSLMRFTQVSDEKGTASQASLGYTGKALEVSYNHLKVASGFAHLKEADLQDVGDLQAGQERTDFLLRLHPSDKVSLRTAVTHLKTDGGDTTLRQYGTDLQLNKETKLAFSAQQTSLRLKDGPGDSASGQALTLGSKVLDVNYRTVKVGSGFKDAKQAGFADVKDLKPGQNRTDIDATLRPLPGKNTKIAYTKQQVLTKLAQGVADTKKELRQSLSLDHQAKGILVQAKQDTLDLSDPDGTARQRNQLFKFELGEKQQTVFLYEKKLDLSSSMDKTNRRMTFATRLTKLCAINFSDTSLKVMEKEKLRTAYERKLRIETEAKNPLGLVFDKQDSATEDGAHKAIQQITLRAKAGQADATVTQTNFDQGSGDQTTAGQNLEFAVKPSPTVNLSGNFLSQEDSDRGGVDQMNLKLQAKAGSVDVTAEHKTSETEKDGGDVKENSLALAAPVGKDTSVQGVYVDRKNKGQTEKSVRAFGFNQGMLGGKLLLELGKTRYVEGHPFATYAVGFTSSQDPKRALRFVTLYRKMGASDGSEAGQYQYGIDWRVSDRFTFSAKSYQNDSVRDGYYYKITPVRGHAVTLDAALSPRLKLCAGLGSEADLQKRTTIRTQNLTLKGNFDSATVIDLSYFTRITPTWKEDTPTHWMKLDLRRDLGDENRLVLTAEGKYWKDSDEKTDDKQVVNARLDFVRVF